MKRRTAKLEKAIEWPIISLRQAGVSLIDCDHRTPPASESGYPYIAIPQLKQGRLDLSDVRRIIAENPELHVVLLVCLAGVGETLDHERLQKDFRRNHD